MGIQTDHSVVEIEKGISFGMSSGAIMEITKKETEPESLSNVQISSNPWAVWGKDNNYPQRIIDENTQDTTSAGALDFKIKAHYGKGLYFYTEEIGPDGKEKNTPLLIKDLPADIKEFWYNNDIPNFQQGLVQDYEWFNFLYVQYIPNAARNKILKVTWKRTKDVRSGKRDVRTGEIPKYYLSAKWPKPVAGDFAEVESFRPSDPFEVANGIYKHQLVSVDKDYYPTAKWQSNMQWLSVSKKIPKWINANIDNSVNIKYHVEIPEKYFLDLYPRERYNSDEEWKRVLAEKETALKQEIDKCLAGADNAQKIFYTKFAYDKINDKVLPGWKITALANNIGDTAWLNAYSTGAAAICTAHGVPPSLAGLVLSSSLNVGSGSDTREKFNYYLQLHTVIPRQTTLEWWDIVSRANRWPENIKLGYRDVMLDTLNNAKSGFQVQNEQSPTSNAA